MIWIKINSAREMVLLWIKGMQIANCNQEWDNPIAVTMVSKCIE